MKRISAFVLCCMVLSLFADVTVTQKGENIILKNEFLEAEIIPDGGRVTRLVNKINGKEMTWNHKNGGASKDNLIPGYVKFANLKHKLQIVKNTPQQAVVKTSIRGTDAFSFIELTKTYTLSKQNARLDIQVDLKNTPESMAETELAYKSHNFYGVPNGKNMVFIPMSDGIKKFYPNEKENSKYNNVPSRGWIGAVSNGTGVVSLYDLSYGDISYSWYCGEKLPVHTIEWQLKAIPVPAGEVLSIKHSVALTDGLNGFSGAGEAAAGHIVVSQKFDAGKPVNFKVRLFGLKKQNVKLVVKLANAKKELNCQLNPGEVTEQAVTFSSIPAGTKFITCDIMDGKGKKLFDLYEKVQIGNEVTPAEMADYPARKKIAANADLWEMPMDWSKIERDSLFRWGRGSAYKTMDTLVLMPTMGARDAVELFRRTDMKVAFPTIFPGSYQMAWREKVRRPGETGIDTLKDYVKKTYDLYIIGGSYYASGDTHLSWNKFPQSTKTGILNAVRNGASLIYVNPDGLDANINSVFKNLDQGETAKKVLSSMDLTAAPVFDKTVIRFAKYGKGKIFVIKFPTAKAYLTPGMKQWATGYDMFLKHRYDYQDYQFAVLAKLVQYLSGAPEKPAVTFAVYEQNGVLKYNKSANVAKIQYAVYNRYGDELAEGTIPANGSISIPALPAGENRIKVSALDKNGKVVDFAFKTLVNPAKSLIRDVKWAKLPIHAGDLAKGEIKYSGTLPAGTAVQVEIKDIMGRLLYSGTGEKIVLDTKKSLVPAHEITAKLVKNGAVQEIFRKNFNVVGAGQENYYPAMLWHDLSSVSDYNAQHYMNLSAKFGFSLLYGGYPNAGAIKPLQYSPIEVSANTFAGLSACLRAQSVLGLRNLPKEQKIRKPCLNDPAIAPRQKAFVKFALDLQKNFGSERYFNMGDEMSITWYTTPVDVCFSKYCLPKFREFLKTIYPSLEALNKHWETEFKTWDSVMPMTYEEVLTRENAAPWSTHREFMDKLFADNVNMQADVIREVFPNGYYGPTGLEGKPYVYGGGTNFEHMRKLTMLSAYGDARIPLSFNRNQRVIMSYRGYKRTELSQFINYWEGLFTGERGANHWYTWSFFQPDHTPAEKRNFYTKLIWELRSGLAALLVNSEKVTDEAAILYSHPSTRSNFLKEDKMDVYENLHSFARYFEDRAMGYRFILPEDLTNGTLNKFKVLVLPEATAISKKQAQMIRDFVNKGGIVVADYETALEDEWNVPQSKGMLDDMFGIRQRSTGLFNVEPTKQLDIRKCGKIKVVKGKAKYVFKDALNREYPVCIVNQFGKGRTVYLNFRFDYAKQRTFENDSLRLLLDSCLNFKSRYTPLMKMDGKPAGRIMTTFYKNGKNTYIGLLPELPRGNWTKAKPADLKKFAFKARCTLPGKGHLYNARTGKYYGTASVQTLDMIPAHAMLLSLLPYKVNGLDIAAKKTVKAGETAKISVTLKTSAGTAGHHVFHMTVKTPDGETPWYFRQTKETANGKAVFEIPFAMNSAAGIYEVTVKDAATGTSKTVKINCKK